MKAEDTVMSLPFTTSLWHNEEVKEHSKAQAEVSLKAGIKVVVDFVKEHNVSANHNQPQYVFYYSDMEAKLKEWGINE